MEVHTVEGGSRAINAGCNFLLATSCRLLLLQLYTLEIGKDATQPSPTWAQNQLGTHFRRTFFVHA